MRKLLWTALEENVPCLVGTATKDGKPQISPKGSVAVLDDDTLSYWERAMRSAYAHLAQNPNVVIYYRNPARAAEIPHGGAAWRFHGVARIVTEGPERERVWNNTVPFEQGRDPEKKGVGVIVRVDRVEELSGKIIMQRE
jgi:hypothetical protein